MRLRLHRLHWRRLHWSIHPHPHLHLGRTEHEMGLDLPRRHRIRHRPALVGQAAVQLLRLRGQHRDAAAEPDGMRRQWLPELRRQHAPAHAHDQGRPELQVRLVRPGDGAIL